jgi:alpha-amylase/alpha-mannosidase (GH57 family)
MEKYICIHGHFYQPPRESPWLEAIELQDSAHPYHDWNERITAECYATNGASRILDEKGRIVQIVNNYARMSFNFGPTLLAWLENKASDVYRAILDADAESQKRFSGHGSALAQPYNHMILPLANLRDKVTQVIWGIKDFEHRFKRSPEGMWLPETAVDLETLDVLAEAGMRFTLLAPRQAKSVRPLGESAWQDVSGEKIDPSMAYRMNLPSGRQITLFFYDGPISKAVAFEGLLTRGELMAERLLAGFSDQRTWPQLVHIATDGESYGHHHPNGDMALAYALHTIELRNLARLTNYGEYLEKHPPTHEVEIYENSSWSCIHGIERWRNNCGCSSGGYPEWNQEWRGPLRHAMDWLRDTLAPAFEKTAEKYLKDPWDARNDYIRVVLDRSKESSEAFLEGHAHRPLNEPERIMVWRLLELQRHAMLMYTSCGWFFDDISGIETVQVIQYAGRSLQLGKHLFDGNLEPRFSELLEAAKSNIPEPGDGRLLFEKWVKPATVSLETVAAHYAMSSLFEDYGDDDRIFCFRAERLAYETARAGRAGLALGLVKVTSEITGETDGFAFGVLHWGDHNISGCVRQTAHEAFDSCFSREVFDVFSRADFPAALKRMERHLGAASYPLKRLFRDERHKILDIILDATLADAEAAYRQLYENYAPLMLFLKDSQIPPPKALRTAAEFILNLDMKRAFEAPWPKTDVIDDLLAKSNMKGIPLDSGLLEMVIRRCFERLTVRFLQDPGDLSLLEALDDLAAVVGRLPFKVNRRTAQNISYRLLQTHFPEMKQRAEKGDEAASQWVRRFRSLCERISVRVVA